MQQTEGFGSNFLQFQKYDVYSLLFLSSKTAAKLESYKI
jgi:hypothetical protein